MPPITKDEQLISYFERLKTLEQFSDYLLYLQEKRNITWNYLLAEAERGEDYIWPPIFGVFGVLERYIMESHMLLIDISEGKGEKERLERYLEFIEKTLNTIQNGLFRRSEAQFQPPVNYPSLSMNMISGLSKVYNAVSIITDYFSEVLEIDYMATQKPFVFFGSPSKYNINTETRILTLPFEDLFRARFFGPRLAHEVGHLRFAQDICYLQRSIISRWHKEGKPDTLKIKLNKPDISIEIPRHDIENLITDVKKEIIYKIISILKYLYIFYSINESRTEKNIKKYISMKIEEAENDLIKMANEFCEVSGIDRSKDLNDLIENVYKFYINKISKLKKRCPKKRLKNSLNKKIEEIRIIKKYVTGVLKGKTIEPQEKRNNTNKFENFVYVISRWYKKKYKNLKDFDSFFRSLLFYRTLTLWMSNNEKKHDSKIRKLNEDMAHAYGIYLMKETYIVWYGTEFENWETEYADLKHLMYFTINVSLLMRWFFITEKTTQYSEYQIEQLRNDKNNILMYLDYLFCNLNFSLFKSNDSLIQKLKSLHKEISNISKEIDSILSKEKLNDAISRLFKYTRNFLDELMDGIFNTSAFSYDVKVSLWLIILILINGNLHKIKESYNIDNIDINNCLESDPKNTPINILRKFWEIHLRKLNELDGKDILCEYEKLEKITDHIIICIQEWHNKKIIEKLG